MIAYAIARSLGIWEHIRHAGPALFVVDAIAAHVVMKAINGPVIAPALKTASMITGHDLTGWEY